MNGVPISDAEAAALLSPICRVKIEGTGAMRFGPTCMRYDSGSDQFLFNLKLTTKGSELVTVKVSYPGVSSTTDKLVPFTIK